MHTFARAQFLSTAIYLVHNITKFPTICHCFSTLRPIVTMRDECSRTQKMLTTIAWPKIYAALCLTSSRVSRVVNENCPLPPPPPFFFKLPPFCFSRVCFGVTSTNPARTWRGITKFHFNSTVSPLVFLSASFPTPFFAGREFLETLQTRPCRITRRGAG